MTGRRAEGFTLVELLVVIAIIALLIGLLAPVLSHMRARALSVTCLTNLKQIAEGFHVYADHHGGYLPPDWSSEPWDVLIQEDLRVSAEVFFCAADEDGFIDSGGLSYAWREWFEVDWPWASLAGKRLASVSQTDLVLVFDDTPDRHAFDLVNAAAVDTSTRSYPLGEFEQNLARPAE